MSPFSTKYAEITKQIQNLDPVLYGKTRNYIDGKVSYLSPYLSRGLISTKRIFDHILSLGYKRYQISSFLQELAWREYYQRIWSAKGDGIFQDLKREQPDVHHFGIPKSVLLARTGIEGIDKEIQKLYSIGYMHNHVRMYLASLVCNIARAHWYEPSRWLYYHLLDGDLASNTCSWQWVAGAFSNKKYIMNQENINRYTHTLQFQTPLDKSYEEIMTMDCPEEWSELENPILEIDLLKWSERLAPDLLKRFLSKEDLQNDFQADVQNKNIFLYHFYHLDPEWRSLEEGNRYLVLPPSLFKKHPVSEQVLQFTISLALENLPNLQILIQEWEDILPILAANKIYTREHPSLPHLDIHLDEREWMYPNVNGFYPSFFNYWKRCEKYLDTFFG
ncbi:FAD binding domain of DNA photolyase [Leptospira ryugenii]|uniref:FAD binding domain of DNA photolyase n=1 Tax=Leptospira ryugenii TaxID=1917863 RepID=A0A2P2DZF7_9LEPT|nr:FAD-binding domain-containing protein [Leptospira ryugenii]GBF50018.1 FAD binding domain of DNA photolyase [Leptospira ryugenii]